MIEVVEVFFFVVGESINLEVMFFSAGHAMINVEFYPVSKSFDGLFSLF